MGDPGAHIIAAVLGMIALVALAGVHPYPQSVIVAVGVAAGALAVLLAR